MCGLCVLQGLPGPQGSTGFPGPKGPPVSDFFSRNLNEFVVGFLFFSHLSIVSVF